MMRLPSLGGDPLHRAVVISLFTWRRANASDPVDDDRCGWWGDSYPPVADDRIGSRLWLLRRRSLSEKGTVPDAQAYAEEALRWLVDDGVLASVSVTVQREGLGKLVLRVVGVGVDGADLDLRFNDVWRVIQDAV